MSETSVQPATQEREAAAEHVVAFLSGQHSHVLSAKNVNVDRDALDKARARRRTLGVEEGRSAADG